MEKKKKKNYINVIFLIINHIFLWEFPVVVQPRNADVSSILSMNRTNKISSIDVESEIISFN